MYVIKSDNRRLGFLLIFSISTYYSENMFLNLEIQRNSTSAVNKKLKVVFTIISLLTNNMYIYGNPENVVRIKS